MAGFFFTYFMLAKKIKKSSKYKITLPIIILALLLVINPIFFTQKQVLFQAHKIIIQQILIILFGFSLLFNKISFNKDTIKVIIIIGLYLIYSIIRSLLSVYKIFIFDTLEHLIPYFILFVFITIYDFGKRDRVIIAISILVSLFFTIIFGYNLQKEFTSFSRLGLSWANANYLASYLLILLSFAYYLYNTIIKKYKFIIVGVAIVLIGLLFWTQSRGGMLSLFIISAFLIIRSFYCKKKWKIMIASIALAVAIVVVVSMYFSGIRSKTIIYRQRIYTAEKEYIKDHWLLGTGFSSFKHVFPKYRLVDYKLIGQEDYVTHAHNEFAEIITESGILGLLLFLSFLFFIYHIAIKKLKELSIEKKYFVISCMLAIILLIIQNQVSITMRIPSILIYFYIICGLIVSSCKDKKNIKTYYSKYIWLKILLILILSFFLYTSYQRYKGYIFFQKSKDYVSARRKNRSIKNSIIYGEKALQIIPTNTELLYQLGSLYTTNKQYDKALQIYDTLTSISPYYPQSAFWQGYVYSLRGDWKSAVSYYQKELDLNEYPRIYFNVAISYKNLNKKKSYADYLLLYLEKITERTERHLILEKEEVIKDEKTNIDYAINELMNYYKDNDYMKKIISEYKLILQ